MNVLDKIKQTKDVFKIKFRKFSIFSLKKKDYFVEHIEKNINSVYLNRDVRLSIFYPVQSKGIIKRPLSLLLFNDGQDMAAVNMRGAIQQLYAQHAIPPILCVGIYPKNRMQEYGTANQADYKNRGRLASVYTNFILTELLPFLESNYSISTAPNDRAIAGFSLGGLSAMDIAWNHPNHFRKVGIFSGALWWRSKAFRSDDPDADRIIHHMVENSALKDRAQQQFWLQTGTNDEKGDRNNNGVIDAIDDTLDLIKALKKIGFNEKKAIRYVEVEGGEHNPDTWRDLIPDFLRWAFSRR